MKNMLLGIETEFALNGRRGTHREELALKLVSEVMNDTVSLPGLHESDRFLSNGSRFYVDCGSHPELSTPECGSPTELLRYVRAGEEILTRAIERMSPKRDAGDADERADDGGACVGDADEYAGSAGAKGAGTGAKGADGNGVVELFRGNVDYSGARTTWGSHESYLYQTDPARVPDQIIPHLVSRVIFAGAGGFNPFSAGLEFTLSPRAWHLERVVSGASTDRRGIFHFKNESLARRGYSRLHLICGETLCSDIATWLRVGTTALVVAMIDAGWEPGKDVKLAKPLGALRIFVKDPKCARRVWLEDGRQLTAIEIQRHYLRMAEESIGKDWMPDWAKDVCIAWRKMLDLLEQGPEAVCSRLDWAIKLQVYRDYVERSGIRWVDLSVWNFISDAIRSALAHADFKGRVTPELVLGKEAVSSPIPDMITKLTPLLDTRSLSWDMLRMFWDLRHKMFELDFRFGQLGERGFFGQLDRAGVLEHRIRGLGRVDLAVHAPPAGGRARTRGRRIKQYAGRDGYQCYWTKIYDLSRKRKLDLSDPFVTKAPWKKFSRRELNPDDPMAAALRARSTGELLERMRLRRLRR